jgi:hypothetical protein
LATLREDTRHWWKDVLAHNPDELEEDQGPYTICGFYGSRK